MKKAFTLVEMILVLIVIWILFLALWYLSWSYIYKLNVQNDKETLVNSISYIQSSSLSKPNFWKYKDINFLWVKLAINKNYITYIWWTWDTFSLSNIISVGSANFYNTKFWTWFTIYSWWTLIWTSDIVYFMYKPYTIWSFLVKQDWTIFTWNKIVKFNILDSRYKDCFKFNVASWRLYYIKCE